MKSLVLALIFYSSTAMAQMGEDGSRGPHYHDRLHGNFYDKLKRPDNPMMSCCNLSDCRPTSSRPNGDHYEVMVDGAWVSVPKSTILRVPAPDGGAHVCAPPQIGSGKGVIYCVVLPPET